MRPRCRRRAGAALLAACLTAGCAAAVPEIRRHAEQPRLERLLAEVLPHTDHPEKHYWVRVCDPSKDKIGLAVLPQRHIYVAEPLVAVADDAVLRALIAHAVAHHRLHHYNKRGAVELMQRAAFKAGGVFVPGLSHAHYVGGPVSEKLVGPGQESSADDQTLEYLSAMGAPADDFARALELMADRGYAERIGSTASRDQNLRKRAERARKRSAKHGTVEHGGG